jgi:hypothetical protein
MAVISNIGGPTMSELKYSSPEFTLQVAHQ